MWKSYFYMSGANYTNRAAGQVRSCAPSSFKQRLTCPCVPTLGHNLPPAQLQLQFTCQHTFGVAKLHFGPVANVSVGTVTALHAFRHLHRQFKQAGVLFVLLFPEYGQDKYLFKLKRETTT